MAEVGLEAELDLCDPNCGTIDCHSYGCIINCSEAPNVAKECKSLGEKPLKLNTWEDSVELRRKDRAGFVKSAV